MHSLVDMDVKTLPVKKRIRLLVDALDGSQKINEALSRCQDGDAMLEILLGFSLDLGLGLSREDLNGTPPIRDWVWWKNKQALVTLGEGTLRHQQDISNKTRWDSWTIGIFKFFRRRQ